MPGDWIGHGGDSFGFASLAMRSDQHNASFAAVANTCNLPEINVAALEVFNADLEARAAATEAPTMMMASDTDRTDSCTGVRRSGPHESCGRRGGGRAARASGLTHTYIVLRRRR